MQHDAADELHVERDHVPGERMPAHLLGGAHKSAAGVFDQGVGFGKNIVERLAFCDAILELGRHPGIIPVGEIFRLVFGFNAVDFSDYGPKFLKLSFVLRSKQYF